MERSPQKQVKSSALICRRKPGSLGQVRDNRLGRESAANGSEMMEYWNVGMLGLVEWVYFYKNGTD
jgi:hypothetical protein